MDPIVKVEKSRSPRALPPPLPPAPASSFQDYCSSLPLWEQQLIQHARQHESTVSLSACLSKGIPLCLCTDGGALKHIGSIGWVIATADEILWDCTGSAFGWNANSFRSEGLSHLSLFVFLQAFLSFHSLVIHRPPPDTDTALPRRRPWIRAATDNEGLLKRLDQALERRSYPFPSNALRAEYNVIVGLINISKPSPSRSIGST
jgi:hypothetical protein